MKQRTRRDALERAVSLGVLGHENPISKHDSRGGTGGATAHSLATWDVRAACCTRYLPRAWLRSGSVDVRGPLDVRHACFDPDPIFRHRRNREGLYYVHTEYRSTEVCTSPSNYLWG